jgi:O-methyltransferase involved in polyketide biosynthesis
MEKNTEYESISPTAIVTAYPRTFTDIPYEKEIYNWLSKNIKVDVSLDKMLAPEIEARYKLANRLLDKVGAQQVLELAAGYSSRGLIYAQKGIKYVEVDLESVCQNKINAIESFMRVPDNLHIVSGNALEIGDLNECKKYFDKEKPLAIINEGLLRYLTFDVKKIVAQNVYKLLSEFGGAWVTCDVTPKNFLKNQDKNLPSINKNLTSLTNRNSINDRFEDKEHIIKFFGEIGFDVEFHYFSEAKNELSSPKILGIESEKVDSLIDFAMVVIMRIKD